MNTPILLIELNKNSDMPLYEQIYNQMREKIIHGKLRVGTKIPSKRKLGEFLHVSQTTIESAYEQLMAEGYIESIPRKGFFVQNIEELVHVEQDEQTISVLPEQQQMRYDFSPGHIDTAHFPFNHWRKYAKNIIDFQSKHLLLLGDPHGDLALREEIARYLYHSRGVDCTAEQIIIGSGTEQLLPLIIRILGDQTTFAIEDPGYPLTHYVFSDHQRQAIPIPVDPEGMRVDRLQQVNAQVAYVTPSHQFPTGTVLSAARRTALLNWAAAENNRYIIEDDYDSEFRYQGGPIHSLQGLEPDKVIYIGTFSKILSPALRLGYLILPPSLAKSCRSLKWFMDLHTPTLQQLTIARFIDEGHLERHVRKMKKVYQGRREHIKKCLSKEFGSKVKILGDSTGLHLVAEFQGIEFSTRMVNEIIQKYRVQIYPVELHAIQKGKHKNKIMLGYGNLTFKEIEEGICRLKQGIIHND